MISPIGGGTTSARQSPGQLWMERTHPVAPEKNGRRSVHDRAPVLECGNDQKKEGARRAPHRAGRRPGRCRPGVRRGVQRGQGWGVGGRHRSRADRWGRGARVLWLREPLSFLPENRKKIRNFSLFFCDPSLLSDFCAGRSVVATERPGAAPSPQPSERTRNILKVWPARPGRVSGFRENGKPEPGPMAGQGGQCGGWRGAAGWCVPEGKH